MAAAYAALLSLFHTLNQIKNHPSPPISLHQKQFHSLTQNLTFFQHFLERYSGEEDDELESRIANAAYGAEDLIETHIVHQIHAQGRGRVMDLMKKKGMQIKKKMMNIMGLHNSGSTSDGGENISYADLYGDVERVIHDMDLIKTDVMEIIQQNIKRPQHLHTNSSKVSTASTWQSSTTPVFDDAIIYNVLDKLVGQQSSMQFVPIVGMGGIGKTTLAKYIYEKPLILQHFDNRAWVTISQEYSRRNTLQLLCMGVKVSKKISSEMSEDEIGLALYQHLCGRRYLIVMDDMWSVKAWYTLKSYFPDDNNGSRIMITTRLSNLAFELSDCHGFQMQFLDEDRSWNLLCQVVFGKQDRPTELEDIGEQIARKCRGLPLSITVIGGLLRKSNMTREYWIYTLENLNSLINLENDEYTLRILRTSYKELPMHLKPCVLYMGIFPEDEKITASVLIKLWVAEGFLRPIDDKSLEEVAKVYLKELIDRNLILVSKLRWNGEAKMCSIHDLLRDVCLREAQKQKFFCVLRQQEDNTPQDINMERRIYINRERSYEGFNSEFLHAVESASLTRSLLYSMRDSWCIDSPSVYLGLLRVYSSVDEDDDEDRSAHTNNAIFKHANLRYLSLTLKLKAGSSLRSLCSLLWNVQTLKVSHPYPYPYRPMMAPSEIWEMPLLKHAMLYNFVLPEPRSGKHSFVLKHLETLSGITNLKFSEEVVKRIPNVKKLKLIYQRAGDNEEEGLPNFSFNNIGCLQKLESLNLNAALLDIRSFENIKGNLVSFPHSLKKLVLCGTQLSWEELTIRIGSLPLLQFLRLDYATYRGPVWETVEGQFCSLRVLEFSWCDGLEYWETESTHFPCLEHLLLRRINMLKQIPSSIGDIPTLKSIRLECCSESAQHSAKRIKVEQQEYGNEDLQIIIDGEVVQVDSDEEDEVDSDIVEDQEEDEGESDEDQEDDNNLFMSEASEWMNLESKAVSSLRSLCSLVWNVQTLKVGPLHPYPNPYEPMLAPSETWKMPPLKHVMLYNFVLPDPPNVETRFFLKYLHTLSGIINLRFSEGVVKRIPNVKKLKVKYQRGGDDDDEWLPSFYINNIGRLHKLESLSLDVENIRRTLVSFPHSLKKLSLRGTKLSWEELTKRIGSLPLLQVLKLDSYGGSEWETVEGQFCSLRLLQLSFCFGLKYWETDNTHFPRLEHLRLYYIEFLKEIPSSIGDISTLKSIRLKDCNKSIKHSAKRIKVEQHENGNEDLQIEIVDLDEEDQEEDEVDSDAEDA